MRFLLTCLLFSVPALATTLFDETITFNDFFPSTGFSLFPLLDPGTYTVIGDLGPTNLSSATPDEDTFSVQASLGNEIVSEEINFVQVLGSNISITEPIDGTTAVTHTFDTILTPASPITSAMDLDLKGTPKTTCTGPNGTPPCTFSPSIYQITFTVQAIDSAPEPSTAALSIAGLALCGLALRFRANGTRAI